jgi:hypothetical protein
MKYEMIYNSFVQYITLVKHSGLRQRISVYNSFSFHDKNSFIIIIIKTHTYSDLFNKAKEKRIIIAPKQKIDIN